MKRMTRRLMTKAARALAAVLRGVPFVLPLFPSLPAWCQDAGPTPSGEDKHAEPTPSEKDKIAAQLISDGIRLAQSKKPEQAIPNFDKAAASFEQRFKGDGTKFFSARTQAESVFYLLGLENARVVSANWAYAYYLKAYALIDLGRLSEAKSSLERALDLSPRNSQFLSELASIYQREKNWAVALQTFQLAEGAAKEFSPPDLRNAELSRAWRGMGYVYAMQGRLDEAEKVYLQCLGLDGKDARAMNELRVVRELKAKKGI